MATKKALLVFTRYYKGEDKNPFEIGTPKSIFPFGYSYFDLYGRIVLFYLSSIRGKS